MVMDRGQIVREYRAAADPWRHVRILAQLNDVGREKIVRVLAGAGIDPAADKAARKREAEAALEASEIRRMREARGLSRRELAELMGVSGNTVALWEMGKTRPTAARRKRMREIFGDRGAREEDEKA